MKRAFAYTRYSSELQDKNTIEMQLRAIREFADKKWLRNC